MTTCKLSLVGSLSDNQNSCDTPNLPKSIIIHDEPDEVVTIGRENSKTKVNYVLGDSSKPRVVSRLHATVRYNSDDGSFWLTDQSVNGTYVNYVRVSLNGMKLETEDIVCFFHRNGANIKPGEKVEPFDTHLKYRVEFVDDDDDDDDNGDDDRGEEEEGGSKSSKERPRKRGSGVAGGNRPQSPPPTVAKRPRGKSNNLQTKGGRAVTNNNNSSNNMNNSGKTTTTTTTKRGARSKVELVQEEEELCAAEVCMRPIGLAIDWIQCDSCSSWYHQMCLGITTTKIIDPSKPYFCPNCRNK